MSDRAVPYNARLLAGDTYVVPGLTNAGFVRGLAIDTCEDEAPYAGVAVDRLAVTHGHADHFSVAAALREAGAQVVVGRDDASLVENPDINIRGMFSWAKPGDVLVTRLFRGEACEVDAYVEDWDDPRAEPVPLPGHTLGHYGFLTPDAVLFTGDALYPSDVWERHGLPYAIDPAMVTESLRRIADTPFEWLVPSHGTPAERDQALRHVEFHLAQIEDIERSLVDALGQGLTTEGAVARVSAERGLGDNPAQYWLAVTTVKGFLGSLLERGVITFSVRDHAGWWQTK